MMRCAIRYHLFNSKNVKNTHGGVLILVKPATLLKLIFLHGCSSRFLNCTNGTKSRNTTHISITFLKIQLVANIGILSDAVQWILPVNKYLFKVNNRNTTKRSKICSLTLKALERRQWCRCDIFTVNFERISHLFLVFQLLTLKG